MLEKELLLNAINKFCSLNNFVCSESDSGLKIYHGKEVIDVIVSPVSLSSSANTDLIWEVKVIAKITNPDSRLTSYEAIGVWNRYATLLSTALDGDDLIIFSKFTIYKNSKEVIESIYAPLANAAIWLTKGLASYMSGGTPNAFEFLMGTPLENPSHWLGISDHQRQSDVFFPVDSMNEAIEFAESRGLVGFADKNRLSVEFPWDPGAVSVLVHPDEGDALRTSLIQIQNNIEHPLYGKGILMRIEFRLSFDRHDLPRFVNALNIWELSAVNLPPFFGSWCIESKSLSPAFVAFYPSVYSGIASPLTLLSWAWGRHDALKGLIATENSNFI